MRYVRGIQLNRVTSSAASIYGRPVVGDLLRDPGPGVPSCLFGQGFGRGFPSVAVAYCAFWEDASGLCRTCLTSSRRRPTGGGLQSLGLGALDNSFLACGSGIPVVKNFAHVIHGKVVSVKIFVNGAAVDRIPPREGSSNTLLMSPTQTGKPNSTGVLDIETGRFIDDWDFKKDGIRDILSRLDLRYWNGIYSGFCKINKLSDAATNTGSSYLEFPMHHIH